MGLPVLSRETLAFAARDIESTLEETATIRRTGLKLPCRVMESKALLRLEHFPRGVVVAETRVTFALNANVTYSDLFDMTDGRSYYVLRPDGSPTWRIATVLVCVQQRDSSGRLALPTNAKVRVYQRAGRRQIKIDQLDVFLQPLSEDETGTAPGGPHGFWQIVWDTDIQYKDGSGNPLGRIGNGDSLEVTVAGLTRKMTLHEPEHFIAPLPYSVARLAEQPN